MFWRGYSSTDEYLPHVFERVFVSRRGIHSFKSGEHHVWRNMYYMYFVYLVIDLRSCPKTKNNIVTSFYFQYEIDIHKYTCSILGLCQTNTCSCLGYSSVYDYLPMFWVFVRERILAHAFDT